MSLSPTTFPTPIPDPTPPDNTDIQSTSSSSSSSSSSSNSSTSPLIVYRPPTVSSILRTAAINLVLPFINGLMLGFGELFAHEIAFRLGWSGTRVFPIGRRALGPGVRVVGGGNSTTTSEGERRRRRREAEVHHTASLE